MRVGLKEKLQFNLLLHSDILFLTLNGKSVIPKRQLTTNQLFCLRCKSVVSLSSYHSLPKGGLVSEFFSSWLKSPNDDPEC